MRVKRDHWILRCRLIETFGQIARISNYGRASPLSFCVDLDYSDNFSRVRLSICESEKDGSAFLDWSVHIQESLRPVFPSELLPDKPDRYSFTEEYRYSSLDDACRWVAEKNIFAIMQGFVEAATYPAPLYWKSQPLSLPGTPLCDFLQLDFEACVRQCAKNLRSFAKNLVCAREALDRCNLTCHKKDVSDWRVEWLVQHVPLSVEMAETALRDRIVEAFDLCEAIVMPATFNPKLWSSYCFRLQEGTVSWKSRPIISPSLTAAADRALRRLVNIAMMDNVNSVLGVQASVFGKVVGNRRNVLDPEFMSPTNSCIKHWPPWALFQAISMCKTALSLLKASLQKDDELISTIIREEVIQKFGNADLVREALTNMTKLK